MSNFDLDTKYKTFPIATIGGKHIPRPSFIVPTIKELIKKILEEIDLIL